MIDINHRTDLLLTAVDSNLEFEIPGSAYTSIFAGEVTSQVLGSGLEVSHRREYVFGDDTKSIDHRASARTGRMVVKVSNSDIAPVLTVVSDSISTHYCAGVETAHDWVRSKQFAALAFSLTSLKLGLKNKLPVAGMFHAGGEADRSVKLLPSHSYHKVDILAGELVEIASYETQKFRRETISRKGLLRQPKAQVTNLPDKQGKSALLDAIDDALKMKHGRGLGIIISDGLRPLEPYDNIFGWGHSLQRFSKRHSTTFVHLSAKKDTSLPNQLVNFASDSGVITTDKYEKLPEKYADLAKIQQQSIREAALDSGAKYVPISLDAGNLYDQLQNASLR